MSNRFYSRFEMLVRETGRKFRRIEHAQYEANTCTISTSDEAVWDISNHVEEVDCVEVLIPVDRLEEIEKLLEFYEKMEKYYRDVSGTTMGKLMIDQRRDELVRIENPNVMSAYEQYRVLLELYR